CRLAFRSQAHETQGGNVKQLKVQKESYTTLHKPRRTPQPHVPNATETVHSHDGWCDRPTLDVWGPVQRGDVMN
ncbi:MAG: hypothetical protein CMJ64_17665, partial [Planctomycetaceae bacterium]|nr:hypothetical protein [Planctomycetaceae bacterium]